MLGMTEGTTKEAALLEDSTFNVITQIEKKADFLYSSVEKYIRDAEKERQQAWACQAVAHYEGRRTKAPENAARTSSKGSKGKQTIVGKIQGYAARQVSIIVSRSPNFFPVQDIQLLLDL